MKVYYERMRGYTDMKNTLSLIPLAGQSCRTDAFRNARPGLALPFAGKYRVIDFTLSNCVYSHIRNVAVISDGRPETADYLDRWRRSNSPSTTFKVLEPKNGAWFNTVDAVFQGLDYAARHNFENLLVLGGDQVYKMDYRKMLEFHENVRADVTVGMLPVTLKEARAMATATVDSDGRISRFLGSSLIPLSSLASMGIYVFNTEFLARRLTGDIRNPLFARDFAASLLPEMARRDRVFAYRFDGYWQDTATLESYYRASMELTREKPGLSLNGISPVMTVEEVLPPACVTAQAVVNRSIVSPGCVVRGRIENSILFPNVWVDAQAVVRDSVVMAGAFIGRGSVVERSVLDEDVRVGEQCYVGFSYGEDGDGVTLVGRGGSIPSHTVIRRQYRAPVRRENQEIPVIAPAPDAIRFEARAAALART